MDWKTFGGAITQHAPELGAVVGSFIMPGAGTALGGAAGKLVSVLGQAFGLGPAPTPDALMTAVQGDPQAALKLAQIQTDHADKILAAKTELAIEELRTARDEQAAINQTMQTELASNNRFAADWRPLVGYAFAIGFFFEMLVTIIAIMYAVFANQPTILAQLPAIIGAFAALDGIAMPVLGIVAHHRGRTERIDANDGEDDVPPAPAKK